MSSIESEWDQFRLFLTPLIVKWEMRENEESENKALAEAEKVILKLQEQYSKTNDKFRKPEGPFLHMVARMKRNVEKDPDKDIYVLLQELKTRMKAFRSASKSVENKLRKDINKLDAYIKKLNDLIRKNEEMEVDLEGLDDDKSPYLYLDKLKRSLVRAYRKKCSLLREKPSLGRPIEQSFHYAGTEFSGVNERVVQLVNSRRGGNFPNYKDILNIVRSANSEDNLSLSSAAVSSLAEKVFKQVGHSLKRRREKDVMLCGGSHLTDKVLLESKADTSVDLDNSQSMVQTSKDPALYSSELKLSLEKNKKMGDAKLESLLEEFSYRQLEMVSQKNPKKEIKEEKEEESEDENEEGEECSYDEASEDENEEEIKSKAPSLKSEESDLDTRTSKEGESGEEEEEANEEEEKDDDEEEEENEEENEDKDDERLSSNSEESAGPSSRIRNFAKTSDEPEAKIRRVELWTVPSDLESSEVKPTLKDEVKPTLTDEVCERPEKMTENEEEAKKASEDDSDEELQIVKVTHSKNSKRKDQFNNGTLHHQTFGTKNLQPQIRSKPSYTFKRLNLKSCPTPIYNAKNKFNRLSHDVSNVAHTSAEVIEID